MEESVKEGSGIDSEGRLVGEAPNTKTTRQSVRSLWRCGSMRGRAGLSNTSCLKFSKVSDRGSIGKGIKDVRSLLY